MSLIIIFSVKSEKKCFNQSFQIENSIKLQLSTTTWMHLFKYYILAQCTYFYVHFKKAIFDIYISTYMHQGY